LQFTFLATDAKHHTFTGLSALTSYTFTIQATNIAGSGLASAPSNQITTFAPPPPPEPVAPTPSPSPSSSAPALASPAFTLSSSSETRTVNTAATGFTINSTGGAIASFAINATPAGMSFNATTGALTGTPTSVASATAYTITATNASGSATATFTLTVNPGAATKAMMTTQPAGAVSGSAFTTQPIVRVTDSGDNTVTSFTGNVVASIASGTGTLSGTTTATAVAGVATFTNLIITGTAGNFTLTFTPTSLTAVTSSSFALAAGAATKVAITRASVGTRDNIAFTTQPQITIQDASGNTVSSSGTVTATISGAGGTLIGTTTATASSGVATFTGLGIDGTNGTTYTITYTVSGLTVATATVTLVAYTVGETGPGGGTIFYVATTPFACGPTRSATCTYLEAAPNGWNGGSDAQNRWAQQTPIDYVTTTVGGNGATETGIGWGYRNTRAIVAQGNSNTANSVAPIADSYTVTVAGVVYDDWFLPSKDELNQMCKWARGQAWVSDATACNNSGSLNSGTGASGFTSYYYWSSSESANSLARMQNFADGAPVSTFKFNVVYIRPIRSF
jgi:hypothetical protein